MNAAAPMNEGNTNGNGASSLHTRASGTSVRTSNHANPVPSTPDAKLTMTANWTVLHNGPTDSRNGVAEVGVERDGPPQHVDDRCGEADGDRDARPPQQVRGPISPRGLRHGSSLASTADRRRGASRSMSSDALSSILGSTGDGSTPAARGYSNV